MKTYCLFGMLSICVFAMGCAGKPKGSTSRYSSPQAGSGRAEWLANNTSTAPAPSSQGRALTQAESRAMPDGFKTVKDTVENPVFELSINRSLSRSEIVSRSSAPVINCERLRSERPTKLIVGARIKVRSGSRTNEFISFSSNLIEVPAQKGAVGEYNELRSLVSGDSFGILTGKGTVRIAVFEQGAGAPDEPGRQLSNTLELYVIF